MERKRIVGEMMYDPETGLIQVSLKNGEKIEAVVTKRNGELVAFVPNWFTAEHVREIEPSLGPQEARLVLNKIEQIYGGWLAEETSEAFELAVDRAVLRIKKEKGLPKNEDTESYEEKFELGL